MRIQPLTFSVALLFALAHSVGAQTPPATGHWSGVLKIPGNDTAVELDIAGDAQGALRGTISIPSQHLKQLPLLSVRARDKIVTFAGRTDQPFTGTLSDDGKWIVGELTFAEYRIPLEFQRAGDAQIEPALRSDGVTSAIEGTWNGVVDAAGQTLRVAMTVVNDRDGKATARIVSIDEGGTLIPIAIVEQSAAIAFDAPATGATFHGTLSADGATISGSLIQGAANLPLTFHRATR